MLTVFAYHTGWPTSVAVAMSNVTVLVSILHGTVPAAVVSGTTLSRNSSCPDHLRQPFASQQTSHRCCSTVMLTANKPHILTIAAVAAAAAAAADRVVLSPISSATYTATELTALEQLTGS